jgi:hypothetical protein
MATSGPGPAEAGPPEVTGLVTAQQYAAGMSSAYAQVADQTAQFVAGLGGHGVDGPAVAAVHRAQELTQAAGAAWAEANTALGHQTVVKEAYMSAPDAGGKAFVTDNAGTQAAAEASPVPPVPAGDKEVKDPLKVGERIVLLDGERFAGSARARDSDGALALVAAVDTPTGRQVHVGLPIAPENRKDWKGGHAPEQEERYDEEDDDTYPVDTGATETVILDAADAAALPDQVEEMIATATAADKEYRELLKRNDRLYDEQARLQGQRFPGQGEEKMRRDWKVEHEEHYQGRRRHDCEQVAERLNPEDRAVHDERQRKIDAAGQDAWEPGKEAEAAEVCGMTPAEFAELTELERIGDGNRTSAQIDRREELMNGGGDYSHPILPPLLEEQGALVCGLTPEEYREMERLEGIPKPSTYNERYNRTHRTRTEEEQARLDELHHAPGGVQGDTPEQTYKLRNKYRSGLENHYQSMWQTAVARERQAEMEATAQPLDAATAAKLEQVVAESDEVGTQLEERGGVAITTIEVPAVNGGALVIEAMQEEETGGVRYRAERKPADADEDWSPGWNMDPYTATAGGMRKLAKTIADAATV